MRSLLSNQLSNERFCLIVVVEVVLADQRFDFGFDDSAIPGPIGSAANGNIAEEAVPDSVSWPEVGNIFRDLAVERYEPIYQLIDKSLFGALYR